LDETRVPRPDFASAAPDDAPRAIELSGSIERADVEAECARASNALGQGPDAGPPGTVVCRLGGLVNPTMPAVEVLARLALIGRRGRQRMRLEHASPAILELLALCGLSEALPCGPDSGGEVGR
jgi:STAS domain